MLPRVQCLVSRTPTRFVWLRVTLEPEAEECSEGAQIISLAVRMRIASFELHSGYNLCAFFVAFPEYCARWTYRVASLFALRALADLVAHTPVTRSCWAHVQLKPGNALNAVDRAPTSDATYPVNFELVPGNAWHEQAFAHAPSARQMQLRRGYAGTWRRRAHYVPTRPKLTSYKSRAK